MDAELLIAINQGWASPWLDVLMPWLSAKAAFSFPLLAAIMLYLGMRHGSDGWKAAFALLLLVGLGDALGNLLKHLIGQARPCLDMAAYLRRPDGEVFQSCAESFTGMPSNHALNFFAVFSFLSFIFRNRPAFFIMLAIATGVALSRVYLGQHYPSQVLVGALLGCLFGVGYGYVCLRRWRFLNRIILVREQHETA